MSIFFISLSTFYVQLAQFGRFVGRPSVLSRDNVGGVPPRPMVLRGGWFVLAMMLLRLTQKLCQRRDVQIAESTSGQARCDLLEQPGIAIRVAERSKGKVAAVTGVRPTDPAVAFGTELGARFRSMEHLTDLDTAGNEIFAGSFDIGNDQVETLGGARRGRRYLHAELNRAPRPGRRELDDPESVVEWEICIEPPPKLCVKRFRAIDIRDWNDDHLELHVHFRGTGAADRFIVNCT